MTPGSSGRVQTRCRRCLEWNDGDPWYCEHCRAETTATPHDEGLLGDRAVWTREKPTPCGDTLRWAGYTNVCDLLTGHEGRHSMTQKGNEPVIWGPAAPSGPHESSSGLEVQS